MLVFLFFIQSVKSIFDQPQFGIILWHLKYYKWTYSKIKSPPIIDSYRKKWFKKFFYNFICFIINHNICVITLWMYCMLFISSQVVVKIISIVDWIYQLIRFFEIIFFKYGVILLRYFLIDSVVFLSPSILYSI